MQAQATKEERRADKAEEQLRIVQEKHRREHDELCTQLRSKQAPALHRSTTDWSELAGDAYRQARSRDVQHLVSCLQEKEWRPEDVASALKAAGFLDEVFESKEVCELRMEWLSALRKQFNDDSWTARLALHLKVDLLLSERKIDKLRRLLCKDYNKQSDLYDMRVWWTNPHTNQSLAYPEHRLCHARSGCRLGINSCHNMISRSTMTARLCVEILTSPSKSC